MKIVRIVLFFSLFAFNISAQNWLEIGTKWHYSYREQPFASPNTGFALLEVVEETVFEGKQCKVINIEHHTTDGAVAQTGREYVYLENNKFYRYIKDDFYLLYDFNANLNDVFQVKIYEEGRVDEFLEIVVDEVSLEVIDGVELKKFNYRPKYKTGHEWMFDGEVIERVGDLTYLFPYNALYCDAGCTSDLRCYQDNEIFYQQGAYDCEELYTETSIPSRSESKELMKVSFDRSTNLLKINSDFNHETLSVSICNTKGQVLFTKEFKQSSYLEIDTSDFPEDLYIINLVSEKDSRSLKFIKG